MRRSGLSAGAAAMALIVTTVVSAIASPAEAAEGFGTKVGTAGKWTVYVETDAMSDEKQCVALFEDRDQVQLSPTSFAISFRGRGGVQAYRLRLDDAPARSLQLATDAEKGVGAVLIDGDVFNELLAAKRVRIQAFTILRSLVDEDIDLSATADVKQLFAKAGCAA